MGFLRWKMFDAEVVLDIPRTNPFLTLETEN
jgi:hypothetical protein